MDARDRAAPSAEFGAVLRQTAMTPASLARLLRRHGWHISPATARAWASGAPRQPPAPAELLDWLRGVAAHLRRDPLPSIEASSRRGTPRRPAEALVDWLRRLVAYHHRNPPPPPPEPWCSQRGSRRALH